MANPSDSVEAEILYGPMLMPATLKAGGQSHSIKVVRLVTFADGTKELRYYTQCRPGLAFDERA